MNACPAKADLARRTLLICLVDLRFARRRRQHGKRAHRIVDQHAGRQAGCIHLDASTLRLRPGLAVDLRSFQRCGVRDHRMAVRPLEDGGPIARHRIQILPRRESCLRPVRLDPAAPNQHLPRRQRLGRLADNTHQLGDRLDLVQIERPLTLANAIEMRVRIRETRIEKHARQIDLLGLVACRLEQIGRRARRDNPPALHADRLDRRQAVEPGIDRAAMKDLIRRLDHRLVAPRQRQRTHSRQNQTHEKPLALRARGYTVRAI